MTEIKLSVPGCAQLCICHKPQVTPREFSGNISARMELGYEVILVYFVGLGTNVVQQFEHIMF
jgi:hypothetical protein